jgi:hypothetical protein
VEAVGIIRRVAGKPGGFVNRVQVVWYFPSRVRVSKLIGWRCCPWLETQGSTMKTHKHSETLFCFSSLDHGPWTVRCKMSLCRIGW